MSQLIKCFLITIMMTTSLFSQEKKSIPQIEKTYVHTDRNSYVIGETLWYKTYTVYAYNNSLFDYSNILYVELLSSDSKIIARNNTKLVAGLGNGDFKLSQKNDVKPGKYQIRAYTNWSRNFGNDFVFKKEIEVIDVFNTEAKAVSHLTEVNSEDIVESKELKFKIQFFPEGGSLIENVSSVIAFKAVDINGNPINVQGQILDEKGEIIAFFASSHDGMGKFQLKPNEGKKYYAKVTASNHSEVNEALPNLINEGFILGYKNIRDKKVISIQTNEKTFQKFSNKPFTIRYSSKGVSYFTETYELTNTKLFVELPSDNLPDGIVQVTLFDNELRSQSERLIYVEKEQNIKVELSTDKTLYKPKEKVVLSVISKNNLGEAVPASFSISGTDLNGADKINDFRSNISSYFLMESDIRGKVNNPGYYFDANNLGRLQHLDLLLLTQGWRDFLWKKQYKINDNLVYKVEKGINISGNVKKLFGKKPVVDNVVSLSIIDEKRMKAFDTLTDSMGKFKFKNLDIVGTAKIVLNSKNKKGKKTGELVLDSIFKSPILTDYKSTHDFQYGTSEKKKTEQNIYKKHVKFNVAPENVLEEVEIIAKKDPTPSFYGKLDYAYDMGENTPSYADIYQLLEATVSNLVVEETAEGRVIRFMRNTNPVLLVINGRITNYFTDLDFFLPEDIIKIEASNGPTATMIFGNEAGGGVLILYTRKPGIIKKPDLQSITKQVEGYYAARVFYTPNLNNEATKEDDEYAIRNTVYWNPYIHPDKTGVSQTSYYNTVVETDVKLTLEGVTATGIPIVINKYYIIEE